jgi:hypothetical protein
MMRICLVSRLIDDVVTPMRPSATSIGVLAISIALTACTVSNSDSPPKQDTTVAPSSGAAAASTSGSGVPAVPGDSAAATNDSTTTATSKLPSVATGTTAAPSASTPTPSPALTGSSLSDTGRVRLHPALPKRGGILFAFVEGMGGTSAPQCQWAGKPIPCYASDAGTLATIPLPADEPAGTYSLLFEQSASGQGRPITVPGKVTVADREFGREAIVLDKEVYALVKRSKDIARDTRAIRRVLNGETRERYWRGAWREPIAGVKGAGYGVERFYYPKSEKSQTIKLDPALRSRALFGVDTLGESDTVPSWRHAGVDIPAKRGAAVSAPQHGVVAEVGDYTLSGRTMLIDHGQGIFSAYFHLDSALVKKGDVVKPGQTIARVGASGLATGAHLHFGIYVHGKDVDPSSLRDLPTFIEGSGGAEARKR